MSASIQECDQLQLIQESTQACIKNKIPIRIQGGNTKSFYGNPITNDAKTIDVSTHQGITNYEPTELILSVRCGTPLAEVEKLLADNHQMLPFEPPHFGSQATVGGCVAAGLSGPRRISTGAVRDYVLGTRIINGKGECLSFGGEVMKNVAGYDVSRLMVGAMGTLGIILDVSFKVLPKPEQEQTLQLELEEEQVLKKLVSCSQNHIPVSASCYDGQSLFIRLAGTEKAVSTARKKAGGEIVTDVEAETLWKNIREHQHGFFRSEKSLWRLSIPPASQPLNMAGKQLIEWHGALRWLSSNEDADLIRASAEQLGGHATLFNPGENDLGNNPPDVFHPLRGKLHELHINLKLAFDPLMLFNPGRMYSDF